MINFIVGFTTAVLSGLGIGGGGLLVIWLVLFSSVEQLTAQGINLVYFLFSSSAAMLVHLTKRSFNWNLIGFLVFFGSIGAIIGSILAKNTSPELIRTAFGILLIGSGVMTLFKKG